MAGLFSRTFGPKSSTHPSVGSKCPICGIEFAAGDYTILLTLQPADDEEWEKMRQGRAYTAEAAEVHLTCVSQGEDE